MRRYAAAALFVFFPFLLFCEKYKIARDILYSSSGMTSDYALEKAVSIDFDREFSSYDELNKYLTDINEQFNNERVLSNVIINRTYDSEITEDGIIYVHLTVFTTDSNHFIVLPYPKYKSGEGLSLKFKMRDSNFLGTMEALNFDFTYQLKENTENVLCIGFDYSYPFRAGPVDIIWHNDFEIQHTIGEERAEFTATTGLQFSLPFSNFALVLDAKQSATREFDYSVYDDELYYTSDFKFSIPITVAKIDGWGKVNWTPYVRYYWNWDDNGIMMDNLDLTSPVISFGHSTSTSRVNWKGNFREGSSMEFDQSVGYNLQRSEYVPKVSAKFIHYSAFSFFGITFRFHTFAMLNGKQNIDMELRGIRDDQKYESTVWKQKYPDKQNRKVLDVPAAILVSLDVPVHVITTDWNGWISGIFGSESWLSKHTGWMEGLDFELQLSPFTDIALTYNFITENAFSVKDGWYTAGIEMIVFPVKWRSMQIRASLGVDAGSKFLKKYAPDFYDDSWREKTSPLELYVGIGLQY